MKRKDLYLSIADVAKVLRISRNQVTNYIHDGLIEARRFKEHGRYYIHPDNLSRFLKQQTNTYKPRKRRQ